MLILALDSSTKTAAVGLNLDNEMLVQFTVDAGNTHSEILLPMVADSLSLSGFTTDEIDLFGCVTGPGSFTGVRIGVATIKGLAFGKNIPCVSVSSLESLAETLYQEKGIICPVIDARREQVYNALFESDGTRIRRLTADRAIPICELDEELAKTGRPVHLIGDAVHTAYERFEKTPRATVTKHTCGPDGNAVARVAFREYKNGHGTTDLALRPTYLRIPQAERERLEKLKAAAESAVNNREV